MPSYYVRDQVGDVITTRNHKNRNNMIDISDQRFTENGNQKSWQ